MINEGNLIKANESNGFISWMLVAFIIYRGFNIEKLSSLWPFSKIYSLSVSQSITADKLYDATSVYTPKKNHIQFFKKNAQKYESHTGIDIVDLV